MTVTELFRQHRAELTYQIPRGLKNEILATLDGPARRSVLLPWLSFGGGAVAACVALLLAFQLGRISESGAEHGEVAEVVSSHVRALMVNHLSDVVSTDQHTVKPWFEGKLDFAPTVKDFAKDGFPLVGGRLDYFGGRTAAALVYKSNQHVINVLQHPATGAPEAPRLTIYRGYHVFHWVKDGMDYWAVSDLNAADLQRFISLW